MDQTHNAHMEHPAANHVPAHIPINRSSCAPCPLSAALPTILLELPVSVVERADLAGLEPSRDAVEVEGVLQRSWLMVARSKITKSTYIADTPGNSALLAGSRGLVCLTLNA